MGYDPNVNPASVVSLLDAVRVSVLDEGLFRVQLSGPQRLYDERPTFQVVQRWAPTPAFRAAQPSATSLLVTTALANVSVDLAHADAPVSFGCGPAGATWTRGPRVPVA